MTIYEQLEKFGIGCSEWFLIEYFDGTTERYPLEDVDLRDVRRITSNDQSFRLERDAANNVLLLAE